MTRGEKGVRRWVVAAVLAAVALLGVQAPSGEARAADRQQLAQADECVKVCDEVRRAMGKMDNLFRLTQAIKKDMDKAKTKAEKDEIAKKANLTDLQHQNAAAREIFDKSYGACQNLILKTAERPKQIKTNAACESCVAFAAEYDSAHFEWRRHVAIRDRAKACKAPDQLLRQYEHAANQGRNQSKAASRKLQACEDKCMSRKNGKSDGEDS